MTEVTKEMIEAGRREAIALRAMTAWQDPDLVTRIYLAMRAQDPEIAEAVEIMKNDVAFLLARLKDFEPGDDCAREYHGHVLPAIERLDATSRAFVEKHSKGK